MKLKCFYFILFFWLITSCNNTTVYKAGGRITLDYPIETKLGFNVISNYLDTMIIKQGFNVPQKWLHYNKLVDIDSIDTRRIYFKSNPEEMYLIQFNGELLLADVYNETIVKYDWVSTPERMPKQEEERVKKRFTEILDKIEKMAQKDRVPDSILYFKPKW